MLQMSKLKGVGFGIVWIDVLEVIIAVFIEEFRNLRGGGGKHESFVVGIG